jgi:hypothetical protein
VVANWLELYRQGAVGFIGWLDVWRDFIVRYRSRQKNQEKLFRH